MERMKNSRRCISLNWELILVSLYVILVSLRVDAVEFVETLKHENLVPFSQYIFFFLLDQSNPSLLTCLVKENDWEVPSSFSSPRV